MLLRPLAVTLLALVYVHPATLLVALPAVLGAGLAAALAELSLAPVVVELAGTVRVPTRLAALALESVGVPGASPLALLTLTVLLPTLLAVLLLAVLLSTLAVLALPTALVLALLAALLPALLTVLLSILLALAGLLSRLLAPLAVLLPTLLAALLDPRRLEPRLAAQVLAVRFAGPVPVTLLALLSSSLALMLLALAPVPLALLSLVALPTSLLPALVPTSAAVSSSGAFARSAGLSVGRLVLASLRLVLCVRVAHGYWSWMPTPARRRVRLPVPGYRWGDGKPEPSFAGRFRDEPCGRRDNPSLRPGASGRGRSSRAFSADQSPEPAVPADPVVTGRPGESARFARLTRPAIGERCPSFFRLSVVLSPASVTPTATAGTNSWSANDETDTTEGRSRNAHRRRSHPGTPVGAAVGRRGNRNRVSRRRVSRHRVSRRRNTFRPASSGASSRPASHRGRRR